MVQMAKSTKYFELFGGLNPGIVRVSTENSKDEVILVRCAIFRPATAEFRVIVLIRVRESIAFSKIRYIAEGLLKNAIGVANGFGGNSLNVT